jgi:hypothetical protein
MKQIQRIALRRFSSVMGFTVYFTDGDWQSVDCIGLGDWACASNWLDELSK